MIKVCLVGNPNTGKTTLLNSLTGSREHVGNWHGVTVEEKQHSYVYNGEEITIVDLPGIYSLSPLSFEEERATQYIFDHSDGLFINLCDLSNLQRNLYLTLSLKELGLNTILVINQIEKKPKNKVDLKKLSQILDMPIVEINALQKRGLDKLNELILSQSKTKAHKTSLAYTKKMPLEKVGKLAKINKNNENFEFFAIKVLENDENICKKLNIPPSQELSALQQNGIQITAKARFDFIDFVLKSAVKSTGKVYGQSKLDKILLNRFLAFPIFICILLLIFYLTFFSLGKFLSGCFSSLVGVISSPVISWIDSLFPNSFISTFFADAIFGGVGSVLGFLPQTALLFFFLAILEDSGYLSRTAFVFDDLLSKVGLSGKSVYTLLMGFGCATSAIITSRTMEDKNSKIKTALLTPYMSCSAKFPIYAVLGGAFFGVNNIFVILGLYFLGAFVAVLLSFILEKTLLKSKEQSFILEFPPYHAISLKSAGKVLLENIKLFLVRIGSVILAVNILVWIPSNFSFSLHYVGGGGESILQTLGRVISPLFLPLGFCSWGLVASLLAGLSAKEVILSTIVMFASVPEEQLALAFVDPTSAVYFSSAGAVLSFLVFCLLYFPCLSSISVLSKEIGKKATILGCLLQFGVAYICSMLVFFVCSLCAKFGNGKVLVIISALFITAASIYILARHFRNKKCMGFCQRCHKNCKERTKNK